MNDKINAAVARWTNPELRPLFKGALIDDDGCCCAQGDILRHECKMSDQQLKEMRQSEADGLVAKELGISRFQAVLLRVVNDCKDGCPQDVLTHPEDVLGKYAQQCLAFGRHLDAMTPEQRAAAGDAAGAAARAAARAAAGAAAWDAAWGAARGAAGAAAGAAARDAARAAAGAAAWAAAWDAAWGAARDAAWGAARGAARAAAGAAAGAMNEIQGQDVIREKGQSFYFLPLFGFATPEDIPA